MTSERWQHNYYYYYFYTEIGGLVYSWRGRQWCLWKHVVDHLCILSRVQTLSLHVYIHAYMRIAQNAYR